MANEPDIIQKLSVDFNVINDISIDFNASPQPVKVVTNSDANVTADLNSTENVNAQFTNSTIPIEAQFGTVYVVGGDCRVLYASTATWNSQPTLISDRGYIYIYNDYKYNEDNQKIAGMKVGDGTSYLIDMPFTDELLYEHLADNVKHITQEEREFWNNKVRCYIDPDNAKNIIFTTE